MMPWISEESTAMKPARIWDFQILPYCTEPGGKAGFWRSFLISAEFPVRGSAGKNCLTTDRFEI